MMLFLVSAVSTMLTIGGAVIPDAMLGTWKPIGVPQSVIGPVSTGSPFGMLKTFTMSKNESTGEHWMSLLEGQVFRIQERKMQYCFNGQYGPESPIRPQWTNEQAPFEVSSATNETVVFCWRDGATKMSIFKEGCSGCDCARITLNLTSQSSMDFLFEFPPPVVHAHFELARDSATPPPTSYYLDLLGNRRCEFLDHTGYLPTRAPEPQTPTSRTSAARNSAASSCPLLRSPAAFPSGARDVQLRAGDVSCYQLNGFNRQTSSRLLPPLPDVRFQFQVPSAPCMPCDVSYTVSAAVADDEYIAVGFAGLNYLSKLDEEHPDWVGPLRPNYFGMTTDALDEAETSDRIALGYSGAAGGCLREMRALQYVGAPTDVSKELAKFNDTSVERVSGRTVLRFKVAQHWGESASEISDFGYMLRVMWAVGSISEPAPGPTTYMCSVCSHIYDAELDGAGVAFEDLPESWTCPVCGQPKSAYNPVGGSKGACAATVGFHSALRGVAPLSWFFDQEVKCKDSIGSEVVSV